MAGTKEVRELEATVRISDFYPTGTTVNDFKQERDMMRHTF